jgi:hypothetical protein
MGGTHFPFSKPAELEGTDMITLYSRQRGQGPEAGFSLESDPENRVWCGGKLLHNNNELFEELEFLDASEASVAEGILADNDYQLLLKMLEVVTVSQNEAKERLVALSEEKVKIAQEDEDWLMAGVSGRRTIKNVTLVRDWNGLNIAFYKKRGYREWLAPCTIQQAREVISGKQVLRYYKNSRRYIIKEAK